MGASLLEGEDGPAVLMNGAGRSPYVIVCEHAGNRLPKRLGTLGLAAADLERHIAWDIGAEKVSRLLARLIDAPLVLQRYSRLVYDCNRPPESPDAMPMVSEVTAIPGNRDLTPAEKLARTREIYRPFHAAIADLLDARACDGIATSLVSIHSFTPVYKGKPRSVELGILHDRDTRLSARLIKSFPNIDARFNEPYGPKDGVLHLLNLHAAPRGLQHAMIEIRNDLIAQERGQDEWAQRLSVPLSQAQTN
ncbi:MAG: N-formylglutamate amidohydrolase [Rhizobiales bacterium]|nr:N-formylglutamate amidohydrolase [Hyphomicrobiales bacterium]MBI3674966.1 N-formylglutamate amidohydrolase [Hyphomicrobiales bacterium]